MKNKVYDSTAPGSLLARIWLSIICILMVSNVTAQTDLTGTVSMPGGAQSSGVTSGYVVIETYDNAGQQTPDTYFDQFIVLDGQSSATFDVDYVPISDGSYAINYGCQGFFTPNCGDILSTTYYTPTGPTFNLSEAFIAPADIPETVALEFVEGRRLTGNVVLPPGIVAAAELFIDVSVDFYTPAGELIQSAITVARVPATQTEGSYSILFPPAVDADGFYTVRYGCDGSINADCQNILADTYFTPNGRQFEFENAAVAPSQLPLTTDLVLVEGQAISGQIALSGGPATADLSLLVILQSYSASGDLLRVEFDQATIAIGASSAAYEIMYAPIDGGFYVLEFGCEGFFSGTCGDLLSQVFFTPDGPVVNFVDAQIAPPDLPDTADLILLEGRTLSGDLVVPAPNAGPGNLSLLVLVEAYSDSGDLLRVGFAQASIAPGGDTAMYSANFAFADDGYYIIEYGCEGFFSGGCGSLLRENYYTPAGPVLNVADAQLQPSEVPLTADLAILEGRTLTGDIALPATDPGPAATNLSLLVLVKAYSASGEFLRLGFAQTSILTGGTISPTFSVPFGFEDDGFYVIEYSCENTFSGGCGSLLSNTFYSVAGPVFDLAEAQIAPPDVPANVNLELVRGLELSGQVQLPSGVAMGNKQVFVSVSSVANSAPSTPYRVDQTFRLLPNGQMGVAYNVVAPPLTTAGSGGFYLLEFGCVAASGTCGPLLSSIFYTPGGNVFMPTMAAQLSALPASPTDLTLAEAMPMAFTVRRPQVAATITEQVMVEVMVSAFDENDQLLGSQSVMVEIAAGDDEADVPLMALPAEGGRYEVQFECDSAGEGSAGCANFEDQDASYSQSISASVSGIPIILQLVPEPVAVDDFESDDVLANAQLIRAGATQSRSLHLAGNEDWVKFTLKSKAEEVSISALTKDDLSKVDIVLYDRALQEIGSSGAEIDAQELDNELLSTIHLQNLASGNYFMKVLHPSPAGTIWNYELKLIAPIEKSEELCFPLMMKSADRPMMLCL